jgi:murein DD-endopeptidase MepM/ murein hydrolase activator NlpD
MRRPAAIAWAAALAALLGVAGAEAGEDDAAVMTRTCVEKVEAHATFRHLDRRRVDATAWCARFRDAVAAGTSGPVAWKAVQDELRDAEYPWAPKGARHAPATRYRLPFRVWMPRLVSQGPGVGSTDPDATHTTPEDYHAWDFLMPIGTEVLAARPGRVTVVHDETPEGVPWEEDPGNVIMVLHDDGTFGLYAHLTTGSARVSVGQTVRAGAVLAHSGNTGMSETPHLHFVVRRRELDGELRAVPIRFRLGKRTEGVVEVGHHAGVIPKSKVELRLTLDGRPVAPDATRPVTYGSDLPLRVERRLADGRFVDVTKDPRVRYETMTVWNVHSPEAGVVRVRAVPGVDDTYIRRALPVLDRSEGLLFVYHGEPRDPDFGLVRLALEVRAKP